MIVLYILLGILALIFLLLLMPLHLNLDYDEELSVRLRYLFLVFRLYPQKEKKSKKIGRPEARKAEKKLGKKKKDEHSSLPSFGEMLKEDGPGAVISYLSELTKIAATAARKLLHVLVADRLELRMQIVGEDAADTAILFGKICAGVYPALSVLQGIIRTKRRQVEIAPDFSGEKTQVRFRVRLHAMPLRLLVVGIGLIGRYLVYTMKNTDKKTQSTQEV